MITQTKTDTDLLTPVSLINIRVCTQIKIEPTLTLTTAPEKATLTGPAIVVEQRGTSPNTAPNTPSGASGATQPPMTQQLADPNPGQVHLWNHQVQVVTTPLSHQTSTTLQATYQFQFTQLNHPHPHQITKNGQSC